MEFLTIYQNIVDIFGTGNSPVPKSLETYLGGLDFILFPVGSSVSGLSTKNYDFDFVLIFITHSSFFEFDKNIGNRVISWLSEKIKALENVELASVILSARVPILKFTFSESDELTSCKKHPIELSVQHSHSIVGTWLLKLISNKCDIFTGLVLAVKDWAKSVGVCDAKKRLLGSYAWTHLVLSFLVKRNVISLDFVDKSKLLPIEISGSNSNKKTKLQTDIYFTENELLKLLSEYFFDNKELLIVSDSVCLPDVNQIENFLAQKIGLTVFVSSSFDTEILSFEHFLKFVLDTISEESTVCKVLSSRTEINTKNPENKSKFRIEDPITGLNVASALKSVNIFEIETAIRMKLACG